VGELHRTCTYRQLNRFEQWLVRLGLKEQPVTREPDEIVADLVALGKPAIPALMTELKDDTGMRLDRPIIDEPASHRAAKALVRIGRPAVPHLVETLDDDSQYARIQAALVLLLMGPNPPERTRVFIELLKAGAPHLRPGAAEQLGKMGAAAKAAIPALKEALKDKDEGVRKAAAEALKKIQQEKKQPTTSTTQTSQDS